MSAPDTIASPRILVVRLGAMGDIVHTLPAAATLKHNHPGSHLTWVAESQWTTLLEGNPDIDRVVALRRRSPAGLWSSLRDLRAGTYDVAVDFQGLIKSAATAEASGAGCIFGFDAAQVRERAAAVFYTRQVASLSGHIVERNLDLAMAVSRGAGTRRYAFPLPPGHPEGDLPEGDFVLACPLAGWHSKQWPLESYGLLGARMLKDLGLTLVLNGPPGAALPAMESLRTHFSGIAGLIHATRRALAVVGVDSGPLHLAAALEKPGVAIFGPTDPARNGPFGGSIDVLRSAAARTTYKRGAEIDESMRRVGPGEVFQALRAALERCVPK